MIASLCDALSLIKRLYDQTLQPVCEQYALTRMELDILLFLANNPVYDTAKDIVERRRLTKSHVFASVQSLEQRGWLERSLHGTNRKTIHLKSLPAAAEAIHAGQEAQTVFFDTLLAGFSPEERQNTIDWLGRISNNARTALTGGVEHAG